ncbi:acetolactate synthase large subunit [Natronoarchaeum rubrum]|uniref:acetolactate synthase large subunit n=1 Tax=Natronoarchaeum rubrum TaxID=755311 RepID=UPI002112766D|nr:acetolactate synthase large subunit [Natronoarchaeum rubrum]
MSDDTATDDAAGEDTTARLIVDCLEAEDVEHVFGIPGEETTELLFALGDSDIEFVPVRHEQAAAFIADVYGRLTGNAGVCLGTLGPGATNLLTGVADAYLDKSPLVALTGQGRRERIQRESHQAIDVVSLFDSVTKWNAQIDDAAFAAEAVRKAFRCAEREKPGPTHLELPYDVAGETVDDEPLARRDPVSLPAPDRDSLDAAVELLESAERPLVLAGNGVLRTRAAPALRSFVDDTGIPVAATYMGKGAVSDADERSLYTLASGVDEQYAPIERADCVVAAGYDVAEHEPVDWNPDLDRAIVHVDTASADISRHYNPDVEIVGDIDAALDRLASGVDLRFDDEWWTEIREDVHAAATERPADDAPLTVERLVPLLRDAMADDDVLVSDVGHHKGVLAKRFPTYEPNTCVISNGLATMGIALPGAIAADLATDANVVAATGDGGFMMNASDLETARRLDCGFTVLVFENREFGSIARQQHAHGGGDYGTQFTNPDFATFADSFDADAYRPESWSAIDRTLSDVVPTDDLSLVAVPVDER